MNYNKSAFLLFLLILISSQIHGMMVSNMRKKQREERRILNKSNLIDTLPKEVMRNIFITYILGQNISSQESTQINAFPCVSKTWNDLVNSSFFIKQIVEIDPKIREFQKQRLKLSGLKQYANINQKFLNACDESKPLLEIETMLADPYVNINCCSLDKYRYPTTPLNIAVKNNNPEIIKLLLDHKANINIEDKLLYYALISPYYSLSSPTTDKIESSIQCFTLLCNAGAKDDGTALNQVINMARVFPKYYYQIIPLFKNTATNSNKRDTYATSLNILLDPLSGSIPDKETLRILMRDYNANPHIKNIWDKTPYDLAKELGTTYNDSEYLEIIQKYDKGIEWYEKNPKGCYTKIS